jgi:segregation and condensation protein B
LHSPYPEKETIARIEAALYSAGRPLGISELLKASGLSSKDKVTRILRDLMKRTKDNFTALEIVELDDHRFVFQVKSDYLPLVRKFAQQPIIPSGALKTLSYIAYEQPVTSKRLVQIRGSQVYTHLRDLKSHSFIEFEAVGRTKLYRTTKNFQEYFGITDLSSLRNKLVQSNPG